MVIGNGMIATRFSDYQNDDHTIIFASGVSNSKNMVESHFEREVELIKKTLVDHPGKQFIYFSTCSVEDKELSNAPYVIHKKKLEDLISKKVNSYIIFRVSNVAGMSNNPFTLLNYFVLNILQGNPITVWENASRNIIDIDDVYTITDWIIKEKKNNNSIINIANPINYPVPEIVASIEQHFNKKATGNKVQRGDSYAIDISLIKPVINQLNIQFNDDYLSSLLKKYYHSR